jgi:DNA-binding XRE family transcriptional regulator
MDQRKVFLNKLRLFSAHISFRAGMIFSDIPSHRMCIMANRRRDQGPFGRRLSCLRYQANLTRDELAAIAGISRHLVQSLEQGRASNPRLSTLLSLANGLGVNVSDLLRDVVMEAAVPHPVL